MAQHVEQRCEKILSNTDTHKLSFPSSIRGHLWSTTDVHGTVKTFRVVDLHGNEWEFCGRLRIARNGSSMKAEVSGVGWTRFVREKGLFPGDKLVFYRTPWNVGPLFLIAVRKRMPPTINLFGYDVYVPPQSDHYDVEN